MTILSMLVAKQFIADQEAVKSLCHREWAVLRNIYKDWYHLLLPHVHLCRSYPVLRFERVLMASSHPRFVIKLSISNQPAGISTPL